jgi:2-polyprenyl-6-methoxyphenol hydroxylase-like FAD-dependent oxidoreductase
MEVFDAMGLAGTIEGSARTIHGTNVYAGGKRVAHVALGHVESPYPHIYGISQRDTEAILAARLTELGVAVERGVTLESFDQSADDVRARLAGGGEIAARWLVGCDGAHSTVRHRLAIPFEGAQYEERLIQADVHVAWPRELPDDEMLVFMSEHGVQCAFFPLFRDGRYRFILLYTDKELELPEPALGVFQAAIETHVPGTVVSDPSWITSFRISHRHAMRYRAGRAFIAGDATHVHSPIGGQGMNTGIQDVFNLAWKLALVQRGVAYPELLDSYEAERAPIATALLAGTDSTTRLLEKAVSLRSPITQGLRNRLMSVVTRLPGIQARAARTLSMLDVGYPDSAIVGQDRASILGANLRSGELEAPSLVDWAAFGDGPAPGERAAPIQDLFRNRRHVALLFDGAAATDAGYANLTAIGLAIQKRCGDEVAVYVVVPRADKPAALQWNGPILFDEDGAVHKQYGARSECLYLVRPDGYVAYRNQPADAGKLLVYLDRIFKR